MKNKISIYFNEINLGFTNLFSNIMNTIKSNVRTI